MGECLLHFCVTPDSRLITSPFSAKSTIPHLASSCSSCFYPSLYLLQLPTTQNWTRFADLHNKRLHLLVPRYRHECQFGLFEFLGNDVCTVIRGIPTCSNSWYVCSSFSYYRNLLWSLIFGGISMARSELILVRPAFAWIQKNERNLSTVIL